ncbi:PEP-CTERM sorting domain-containing protein [Bythopirellula polymerisocia]|uniref:Matrixin n=1 Tax=Bythopirellula polymerisocia TaxID=2528003 RepID=A0A5C6D216_9BACT|nr:PEP-CTERM sorting domain-containing protein [Bythopirellula polymerisocia]TWU29884.1 hypothetical protein Pla144_06640 [Bythopirellula polymerisocia]
MRTLLSRSVSFFSLSLFLAVGHVQGLQTVWVDFDTFTTPEIPGEEDDYEYSPAERGMVLGILHEIFRTSPADPLGGAFGIDFLDTAPPPFTSTLVKVNAGLGHAEKIDFRNLDDDDDVTIHPVKLLKSFVGLPRAPEFGGGAWTEVELLTSPNIAMATANLAAHELGHSFGLRHHDSFTPIGSGIGVSGDKYVPTYLGGTGTAASFHIMGLNSAVALSAENLITPSWISPRSAVKLMINKIEDEIGDNPLLSFEADYPGGDVPDGPSAGTPAIPIMPLSLPNTTRPPDPFGINPASPYDPANGPEMFPGFAGVVVGRLEDKSAMETVDVDYYSFFGPAGAKVTVEVISEILSLGDGRFTDPVDPHLELLDSTLAPLPYPAASVVGMAALNDDQFESTDSILFDVVLPYSGEYFIEIRPAMKPEGTDVAGDYELLVSAVAEIPAGSLAADFDDDGDVDGEDLIDWQMAYGSDASADADDDGDSDGHDFLIWQIQHGASVPLTDALTSVPEPSSEISMLVGALVLVSRRRVQKTSR